MSSTVWAAPAMRICEANILRFLKDARCSVRLVEVSLFKEFIFDRVGTRRWELDGNLPRTAKEISKYVADGLAPAGAGHLPRSSFSIHA